MAKGKKTGGRVAGTLNKATAEVRALAMEFCPSAVAELGRLSLEAKSEQARVAAITALLDRACGKPAQALTDADGTGPAELIIRWLTGTASRS
jgi:hypothetical protein